VFLTAITLLNAQNKTLNPARVNREVFFGRQPSAQAEALGQTGVTYSDWINPAADFNNALTAYYSYANPFSYWDDVDYHYSSISARVTPNIKIGVSYQRTVDEFGFTELYNYIENNSISKLNFNYQVANNFFVGINADYIYNWVNVDKYTTSIQNPIGSSKGEKYSEKAWSTDLGLAYKSTITNMPKHQLLLAASCQNAFATKLECSTINYQEELPVILKIGSNWLYKKDEGNWSDYILQFHYQYQKLLNSSMCEKHSFGLEYTFFQILTFRGGYFNEVGNSNYYINDHFTTSEFTYGSGLSLDFNRLLPYANLPITVKIDYAHLPLVQRTNPELFKNNTTFNSFTISAAYDLK